MTSRELFNRAIEVVLDHEGGYVDHPTDPGGATNFGISSRSHPEVDIENLTRDDAIEIYWTHHWQGRNFDMLPEKIATKTFDLAVNMGLKAGVVCLQRALRSCGILVSIDGVIGPETASGVAGTCELALVAALRSEAASHYRLVLARDEGFAPFAEGWMNRAYS